MTKHEPILNIYRDGDSFFIARPGFVNLQESEVAWLAPGMVENLLDELEGTSTEFQILCERLMARDTTRRPGVKLIGCDG